MISAQEQIQILYEIALSIGEGVNLKSAAKNALAIYLRKLNCSAGAIFQKEVDMGLVSHHVVTAIPRRIERVPLYAEAIKHIPFKPVSVVINDMDWPIICHLDEGGYSYLMQLKGFGLMLLIKNGNPLPEGFIQSMEPLNQKLADSLVSFVDREKLNLQSQALESNTNAIVITDNNGVIEWVNKAWCKLNGYSKEEAIGEKPSILKSGQHSNRFYKELWQTISSGKTWTNTLINRKKNGGTYYFEYSINPVFNEQGEIINFIGTGQDVTLRKKALDELKESKVRFEDMANLLPQPIWETNSSGWFTYSNKAGYKVMGYNDKDLDKGVLFIELIAPEDRQRIIRRFQKIIDGERVVDESLEYLCKRKNGTVFPALIFTTPIWKNNSFMGLRGITLEITDLKRNEAELIRAKEKAENAEMAQFKFLSTMSHEIRTPLNAVIGLTNILLMENPLASQMENLETLKFSSQNLLNIINDILDFNKLYSNNVKLEKESFCLIDIFKGMQVAMNSLAQQKSIYLRYHIAKDIPKTLIGDSTRLQQIINNLVSNAIKFTNEGGIKVNVSVHKRFENDISLTFEVIDTGIGIPIDRQGSIFEEFQQASSSITREYGGTGLGLPIVKRLLNLMGSDITLQSAEGKGSRFFFQISFLIGEDTEEEALDIVTFDDSLKGKKILLVEDNKVNQMVAMKFLESWKCVVAVVENGEEAIERIAHECFDLILMDLHMPVMDGYKATRMIREMNDEKKKDVPIIALSASALGEIETRAKKHGMDDFVTKPFNPEVLFAVMRKYVVLD